MVKMMHLTTTTPFLLFIIIFSVKAEGDLEAVSAAITKLSAECGLAFTRCATEYTDVQQTGKVCEAFKDAKSCLTEESGSSVISSTCTEDEYKKIETAACSAYAVFSSSLMVALMYLVQYMVNRF